MRYHGAVLLMILSGWTGTACAKHSKKAELPTLVCPARFVYVQTSEGDVLNPNVLPEDRSAAARLQDNLRAWNRYSLVYQRNQADLIFVVRTGRAASVEETPDVGRMGGPYGRTGAGPNMPRGNAPGPDPSNPDPSNPDPSNPDPTGMPGSQRDGMNAPGGWGRAVNNTTRTDIGPADDLLALYGHSGDIADQVPLWQRTRMNGLEGPHMALVQQLLDAVDDACRDWDAHNKK